MDAQQFRKNLKAFLKGKTLIEVEQETGINARLLQRWASKGISRPSTTTRKQLEVLRKAMGLQIVNQLWEVLSEPIRSESLDGTITWRCETSVQGGNLIERMRWVLTNGNADDRAKLRRVIWQCEERIGNRNHIYVPAPPIENEGPQLNADDAELVTEIIKRVTSDADEDWSEDELSRGAQGVIKKCHGEIEQLRATGMTASQIADKLVGPMKPPEQSYVMPDEF